MYPAPSAKKNACKQGTIGFGFTSDWLGNWREIFFSQSQVVAMQNQSNREIIFDTIENRSHTQVLLKITILVHWNYQYVSLAVDANGLQLEIIGQFFQVFPSCLGKIA